MLSPTPLRDIGLTAAFEIREMLRSRRAFLVIALYLLMAAFATFNFVRILNLTQNFTKSPPRYQREVRGPTAKPVVVQAALPKTPAKGPSQGAFLAPYSPFRGILSGELADEATENFLVSKPLIALYFMLVSLVAVPILIMITASESVAQELQTRGVRFTALRTGRLEFVTGKVLGQALLMAVVVMLSGCLYLAIADWKLQDFTWGPAMAGMAVFWPRIVIFCLPFVALAALCSMLSSSTLSARAFSLLGVGALWMVHELTSYYSDTPLAGFFTALDEFEPYAHETPLWTATLTTVGPAMLSLVGLAVLYVGIGLIFYSRRDL